MAETKTPVTRPKGIDVNTLHKGFSCSPGRSEVTMKVAANLKIPDPMQNKYRSPHSSVNTSPSSRARSSVPGQKLVKRVVAPQKMFQVNHSLVGRFVLKDENSSKGRKDEVSQSFIDLKPKTSDENIDQGKMQEATIKGRDAEISRMDYLIKKYKQDISDQTAQMQELKRTVQSYDLKIEKLVKEKAEERMSAGYDQLLKQKDREVFDIKQKFAAAETEISERYKTQFEHMSTALSGSQALVRKLEEESQRLRERVTSLESNTEIHAVEAIKNEKEDLKSKNHDLTKQLTMASNISTSTLKQLENQIKELEEMQLRLMSENNQLKEELISEQRRHLSETDNSYVIKSASRDARQLLREISQLTHLFDTMRRGADVNLSFLLGPSNLKEDEGELSLKEEMGRLRSEMSTLRTLVSDCYAEQCGSRCLTQ